MNTNTTRLESIVLVVILLTVAGFAGAASFTHVKDWTMANSPAGTHEWFGWANAVISELIPAAALLTIRQRRRTGAPIGYPMFLLVCAIALSLAAQVAVAKPSLSGWLLSAVPALAFLGLSKLVLTTKPTPPPAPVRINEAPVDTPAPVERAEPAPPAPQLVTPVEPPAVRVPGVVPVPSSAFTRVNGTPIRQEATR